MATYTFKLPDLGEGIVESEISAWHISVGDTVSEDQHIADVMTDKAVVEVSSPVSGKVTALACEAGETVAVGSELVRFEVAGSENENREPEPEPKPEPKPEDTGAEPASVGPVSTENQPPREEEPPPSRDHPEEQKRVLASPSVRRRAREAGIHLDTLAGTGPEGRIGHRDLDARLQSGPSSVKRPREGSNTYRLGALRRTIARRMQAAKRNIPHYSYIEEIDVTQLEELRLHLNAKRREEQPKLTLLPFFATALVRALPEFPHCNAHFDDEEDAVTEYEAVHLGVAAMTEKGLMVPVMKHCEALGIHEMASEIARLSSGARDGTLKREDLQGSTISLTSLGAIGGIATTPIINAPETAIIGINRMQERPVVINGAIAIRRMMNVSGSFDHRIVDGYDGALFVQRLKELLENPGALFVE